MILLPTMWQYLDLQWWTVFQTLMNHCLILISIFIIYYLCRLKSASSLSRRPDSCQQGWKCEPGQGFTCCGGWQGWKGHCAWENRKGMHGRKYSNKQILRGIWKSDILCLLYHTCIIASRITLHSWANLVFMHASYIRIHIFMTSLPWPLHSSSLPFLSMRTGCIWADTPDLGQSKGLSWCGHGSSGH